MTQSLSRLRLLCSMLLSRLRLLFSMLTEMFLKVQQMLYKPEAFKIV